MEGTMQEKICGAVRPSDLHEIDLAIKALQRKIDKSITGQVSYDLFEAQALLNAIQAHRDSVKDIYMELSALTSKVRRRI
jgi:uncharacterized Fe-S cluster-containing radical SAM superfamily enzyme